MQTFDFVIIGAGPAGEAAAYKARSRDASVAIADAGWFGGSCPHIGCLPSKALLHAADRHASGADYPWARASEHRDFMVNRRLDAEDPDDSSHLHALPLPAFARSVARRPSLSPAVLRTLASVARLRVPLAGCWRLRRTVAAVARGRRRGSRCTRWRHLRFESWLRGVRRGRHRVVARIRVAASARVIRRRRHGRHGRGGGRG